MKSLQQIWDSMKIGGCEPDKGSIHSYIPVYEELLAPYRERDVNVLEIGVFNGHSMMMWRSYFSSLKTKIIGIDCSETPIDGMADLRPMIKAGWNIHIFDAEDKAEVEKRFSGVKFDVIIDDAGHHLEQQLNLFSIWKEYLTEGGLYIVEDVQDIDKDKNEFMHFRINRQLTIYDLRGEKNR